MEINKILKMVDHTNLKPEATEEDIAILCADAKEYGCASVCVAPSMVRFAANELEGSETKVCTVIGFPCGYSSTRAKAEEVLDAIDNGAEELDMVINIGKLKDRDYDYVKTEIEALKCFCGDKILKVIIETCLLTEEEKIKMCEIVTEAGADFIKTSTGFSTGGATFEDIKLFKENVGPNVKIKAAGGISSIEDAEKFIELGAERLGTSRIVKILKEQKN